MIKKLQFFLVIISLFLLLACHQERNESIKLMNAGIKAHKTGNDSLAIQKLQEASTTDPSNAWAYFYKATILEKNASNSHAFEAAAKAYQQAIDVLPGEFLFYYHQAVVYAKLEENQQVIDSLLKGISVKKGKHKVTLGEAYYRLGQAYMNLNQYDKAQEAWHQAIINRPQLSEAYSALAGLYLKFKIHSHAAQVLKNAIENHPEEARHYRDLGLIYQQLQNYPQALDILEKGFEKNESASDFLYFLGETYVQMQDDRRAEVYFHRYLKKGTPKEEKIMVAAAQKRLSEITKRKIVKSKEQSPTP
jgi:tetratricopeptide (TPR) repeat protein